jgi:prepilin-type N-terminal cleavage/methylation domain-containing protein
MPRWHGRGFTLIELLVVIGIFAILTAIIVPIGQRLRENNRTSTCEAQLAHIGQALKMYFLDEGGVPPIGVPGTLAGTVPSSSATDVDFKLPYQTGLQTLFYMDYLGSRTALHCPRHTKALDGTKLTDDMSEYYQSYMIRDPRAKPESNPLLQHKYMPFRYQWNGQDAHAGDARRQLTTRMKAVGANWIVTDSSTAVPPDDTIVTWCNYHADNYRLNGLGQYVVLYWDGSVQLIDAEVFRGTGDPSEAWLIRTTDIAH